MRRRTLVMCLGTVFVLAGCSLSDLVSSNKSAALNLTSSALTGKVLSFTNPSPNTARGEQANWEYTFQAGRALGCNQYKKYTSTGWTASGKTIRVNFGSQYEQYRILSSSGTLESGNLTGTFELTSSANQRFQGSFRQVRSSRYC